MPASVIKSWSDKYNIPKPELENKWKEAKKQAAEQGHKEDYYYVMGIFKKMTQKDRTNENRNNLRNFIMENIPSVEEGIIGGAIKTGLRAPGAIVGTGMKAVGSTLTAPLKTVGSAVGGGLKAAGQLARLKPGKALKTLGKTALKTGKAAVSPVTSTGKYVGKTAKAVVKDFAK